MKLLIFFSICLLWSQVSCAIHEDWGLNIFQLLDKYQYSYEAHTVVTEDGYVLGIHRITSARYHKNDNGTKPVVLIYHGLESSSADFVNSGPESGTALRLADKGYDVWLGNCRGNTWSEKHLTLDSDTREFWDFSFHEIGNYDLPAVIDYILGNTGKEKLSYVGHSQGTTIFFACMASRPEYNDKITLMIALAPVAHMTHMTHPLVRFMGNPIINLGLGFGIHALKFYNILPHWEIVTLLGGLVCNDESSLQFLCAGVLSFMGGMNEAQLNKTFMPVIVTSAPAGTSHKQMMHYIQEMRSGHFRPHDYGLVKNRQLYGQNKPKDYNVKKITAPVALLYANKDLFAEACDVEQLKNELPNVVTFKKVDLEDFTHLNFLWAIDLNKYVNNDVIALLDEHNNKIDPSDIGLDIFLEKYNYPVETHEIITDDGYILHMQRIPTGRNGAYSESGKPPILLVHGLGSSAMDFVNYGPGKAIGLMLADSGYDVWLANCRGNTWSRNHTTLDPTQREYYQFSFHEIAYYDLPAEIDYILKETGKEQVSYIGHSQGTTVSFIMGATRPEYNKKISIMAALAPSTYAQNMSHPLVQLGSNPLISLVLGFAAEAIKMHLLVPHYDIFTDVGRLCQTENSLVKMVCEQGFYLIGGRDEEQLVYDIISIALSNAPAGFSYKQGFHYLQLVHSGFFRPYDYGVTANRQKYGNRVPPSYNLKKVTAPVALYYGANDWLAGLVNVERLKSELPNCVKAKLIEFDKWMHLDFLWAKDVVELLNNDLIALFDEYNNVTRTTELPGDDTSPSTISSTSDASPISSQLPDDDANTSSTTTSRTTTGNPSPGAGTAVYSSIVMMLLIIVHFM
ncbi:uncharacterized protein LOC109604814 [Aethina tumida]|uniref:uncharacterized protein LOC109604814 n=1 Tax=Aethina tumida TaxID=116153 RepID=UPI0021479573|nr:uncharacterized protein LOC109604814 [Aethina tumida]